MKILYVSIDLGENGIDTWIKNYSKILLKNGNQVDFVIFNNEADKYVKSNFSDSNIFEVPKYSSKVPILSTFIAMLGIFKSERYDIVHVHHDSMSSIPLLALKISGYNNRLIHSHTTSYPNSSRKFIYRFFKKFINLLATDKFAVSNEAAEFLYNSPSNTYIINSAIDTKKFEYSQYNRDKIRRKLGISESDVVIGIVGRLSHVKNHDFYLKIAQNLPEYKFYIIGEGELKGEIISKIKYANLNNVFILGSKKDIEVYYSMFDILLLPSFFEGIPFTLIEAQASGIEIIASNKVNEESDITGTITFLNLEMSNWIKSIKKITSYDRALKSRVNCKKITQGGYNLETEGIKLEKIYSSIIKKNNKIFKL